MSSDGSPYEHRTRHDPNISRNSINDSVPNGGSSWHLRNLSYSVDRGLREFDVARLRHSWISGASEPGWNSGPSAARRIDDLGHRRIRSGGLCYVRIERPRSVATHDDVEHEVDQVSHHADADRDPVEDERPIRRTRNRTSAAKARGEAILDVVDVEEEWHGVHRGREKTDYERDDVPQAKGDVTGTSSRQRGRTRR